MPKIRLMFHAKPRRNSSTGLSKFDFDPIRHFGWRTACSWRHDRAGLLVLRLEGGIFAFQHVDLGLHASGLRGTAMFPAKIRVFENFKLSNLCKCFANVWRARSRLYRSRFCEQILLLILELLQHFLSSTISTQLCNFEIQPGNDEKRSFEGWTDQKTIHPRYSSKYAKSVMKINDIGKTPANFANIVASANVCHILK